MLGGLIHETVCSRNKGHTRPTTVMAFQRDLLGWLQLHALLCMFRVSPKSTALRQVSKVVYTLVWLDVDEALVSAP